MRVQIKQTYSDSSSVSDVIDTLLKDRGIRDMDTFLNPVHPTKISLEDFFSSTKSTLKTFQSDWKKTVKFLKEIKENNETIVVYTDYDADGVTGGAVMWETLHKLGFNTMPYIPDRKKEGYGFSKIGLDHVIEEYNPSLIISVDHGIVAHKEISYAKKKKLPIIVTDHHQKDNGSPKDAFAVFHTDQVSGSGVSYFVAKEIFKELDPKNKELAKLFEADYLALAAVGTIADLVPLNGFSRSVAKYGLDAFKNIQRYGIKHLLEQARIGDKKITAYEVGYIIAPRINAFGRIDHAIDALRLLCTTSPERAKELAQRAGTVNKERQDLVKVAVEEARKKVDDSHNIIILESDSWEEGIIGLIAGNVLQKYYKPTIAMTRANGFAKASVRSVDGVDIISFLRDLRKHLMEVGGHKAAAGFTIDSKKIDTFIKAAYKKADKEITEEMLEKIIRVDAKISLSLATMKLAHELEKLEPFGMSNPKPLFASTATIQDIAYLGKLKKHIKLLMRDGEGRFLEGVYFNGHSYVEHIEKGSDIDVVYNLDINRWGGREKLQALIKHINFDTM